MKTCLRSIVSLVSGLWLATQPSRAVVPDQAVESAGRIYSATGVKGGFVGIWGRATRI